MSHSKNRKPEHKKPEIHNITANDLPPELAKAVMFCAFCKKQGKPVPNLTLDPVHRAILAQLGLVIDDKNVNECKRLHGMLVDAVKHEQELLSACEKVEKRYEKAFAQLKDGYENLKRKYNRLNDAFQSRLFLFSVSAFALGVILTKFVIVKMF